jgi:small subunit ribosomal protein S1
MIKLERGDMPQDGIAFVAMPYGIKQLDGGESFDFDELYDMVYASTIGNCGMIPRRADRIWGTDQGILDTVWRGIQCAEVVIVDCTTRSIDVGLELGLSMSLGKRLIVVAQRLEDIPNDVRGHLRPVLWTPGDHMGAPKLMQSLANELKTIRAEAVTENAFVPLKGASTEPAPGRIVLVEKDRAVVETDGGHHDLLPLDGAHVTYSRFVTDMTHLYKVGDRLDGAITTNLEGARFYTLLADQLNPWPDIEASHPVGTVFTGRVQNIVDGKGAWVGLAAGINGYLPMQEVRQANLHRHDEIEAEVISLDPAARKVSLRLRHLAIPALPPRPSAQPLSALGLPRVGDRMRGWVVKATPEKGFILLQLEGYENGKPAILHISRMTPDLRDDLRDGKVEMDEEISVEVTRVDSRMSRIELLELPESDAAMSVAA